MSAPVLRRNSPLYTKIVEPAMIRLETLCHRYNVQKATMIECLLLKSPVILPCEYINNAKTSLYCKKLGTWRETTDCAECSMRSLKWWGQ